MNALSLELRMLRPDDETAFKTAVADFKNDAPPWTFAFDFDECDDFSLYVQKLDGWSRGIGLPERFVPNTFLVGVVSGTIVGRLSLRHRLNDFLGRIGGHIGYGVIPSCRRQGYATAMLQQSFPLCRSLGIKRALLTCDVDNVGSRKVIETCGGVFEGLTDDADLTVQKRRYWITL